MHSSIETEEEQAKQAKHETGHRFFNYEFNHSAVPLEFEMNNKSRICSLS
jgi:hypothetical protein